MKPRRDKPLVRIFKGIGYATALLTLVFGLSRVWESVSGYYARRAQVRQLLATSEIQHSGADYRTAWETLEKAATVQPSEDVVHHQEDLAMEWLRNIRVPEGQTFSSIVNRLSPVLTTGAIQSAGMRKADLLAHLGWGSFLRIRDGERDLRPDKYFDDALSADPSNVFAHSFKGFWILWDRGPVAEASAEFRSALDSKRERQFVRDLEFAALFNNGRTDESVELLRVAEEMVRNSETITRVIQQRIYTNTYWESRHDESMREAYLKALDVQDHLKMFLALYGPGADSSAFRDNPALRDFWLATLLERSGRLPEALAKYVEVKNRFQEQVKTGQTYRENYIQANDAAIRRLSTTVRVP
jgi:hypothetical protein